MALYQSLVTVNPVTLIAQIGNLFLQLLIAKIFFLDKMKAILDQRREEANREITNAQAARAEAEAIKAAYRQNMNDVKVKADNILTNAQRTANSRSEELIRQAQATAAQIKAKASSDMERERNKAIREAKNELSDLAIAIASKVLERELNAADHDAFIENFLKELEARL